MVVWKVYTKSKILVGGVETIVALASSRGRAGVSVIRISGPLAFAVGARLFGRVPAPGTIKKKKIMSGSGDLIDSALVSSFKSPRSYTGEDVVELFCHGNPLLVEMVIDGALEAGARHAEPGEFTKRAFLNDKMDLAQAEFVADLISAQTKKAVLAASNSLSGAFSKEIDGLIDGLTSARVWVEANLDFSDEDVDELDVGRLKSSLAKISQALSVSLLNSKEGSRLNSGVVVAIVGKPNVGKSTLLNSLAKNNLAIVSDTPGTTRDLVRAQLDLRGYPVEFVDTAGIRKKSKDKVEMMGMRLAKEFARKADLVINLAEVGGEFEVDRGWQKEVKVFNKIDVADSGALGGVLGISAKNQTGLDLLVDKIFDCLDISDLGENQTLARSRHVELLKNVKGFVEEALVSLSEGASLELVADSLQMAQKEAGEITRPVSSDDLLGNIFSSFCIGK